MGPPPSDGWTQHRFTAEAESPGLRALRRASGRQTALGAATGALRPFWSAGGLVSLPFTKTPIDFGGKVFMFDGSLDRFWQTLYRSLPQA